MAASDSLAGHSGCGRLCTWQVGRRPVGALALLLLFSAAPLQARVQVPGPGEGHEEPIYVVPRLQGPIVLDGRVDEPAWMAIDPLPAVRMIPEFGTAPTERTEFRLAHDGEYLYFSCRNFDSDPSGIRATTLRRDDSTFSHDICHIFLDTLNDEENALGFSASPAGTRLDVIFTNDARGSPNFDWNAFWDAAVSRDAMGWYAELRIPFSSLLFQEADGNVVMGVSMLRNIARKNERITHPAMQPGFGFMSFGRPSGMRKILLQGVSRSDPVYLTPYVLAGGGYTHSSAEPGAAQARGSERTGEVGADLRYGLTSNLTLDLTFNTDFAQVEADDQQVNLTRFSLFFPEKRRFFQERGSVFEYSLGGQERVFHSRRIGLSDGVPVRILGGARVVGRIGEWDVGALSMQTGNSDVAAGRNQGVFRVRRRLLNANSYAGGILTTQVGSGGDRNVVAGLDAILRLAGNDYLVLNWVHGVTSRGAGGDGDPPSFLDRGFLRAHWERRGDDGWSYSAELSRAGSEFRPEMGFLRRRGHTTGTLSLGYGWRPTSASPWQRYSLEVDGSVLRRHQDSTVETMDAVLRTLFEHRSGHQVTISAPVRYENLPRSFPLAGGVTLPAGSHTFAQLRLQYRPSQTSRFRPAVTVEGGQFFDGTQFALNVAPTWVPSMHFSLSGTYRLDRVEFLDRGESFTAHVARIRAEVMLSVSTSAVAFVQYNSAQDAVITNLRFRYNPREGDDFYIVWNEGLVTNGGDFDPVRPVRDERTILLKYSRTLRLRG